MDILMNLLLVIFICLKILMLLNSHFASYFDRYAVIDYKNCSKLRFKGSITDYLLQDNYPIPPRSDYAGINNFSTMPLSICALIEDIDEPNLKEFHDKCYQERI